MTFTRSSRVTSSTPLGEEAVVGASDSTRCRAYASATLQGSFTPPRGSDASAPRRSGRGAAADCEEVADSTTSGGTPPGSRAVDRRHSTPSLKASKGALLLTAGAPMPEMPRGKEREYGAADEARKKPRPISAASVVGVPVALATTTGDRVLETPRVWVRVAEKVPEGVTLWVPDSVGEREREAERERERRVADELPV